MCIALCAVGHALGNPGSATLMYVCNNGHICYQLLVVFES